MVSDISIGVACMTANGCLQALQQILVKLIESHAFPSYFMLAVANSVGFIIQAVRILVLGISAPIRAQYKMLALRGLLAATRNLCMFGAVLLGANLGDIAAMSSVSALVAPLLGRLFLGEVLQWKHALAFCCTCAGVVLITQPSFIFGGRRQSQAALGGDFLGVGAGVLLAFQYVVSRKLSTNVHPAFESLTAQLAGAPLSLALGFASSSHSKLADSLQEVTSHPWQCIGWQAAITGALVFATSAGSMGSQKCPAGVSAILNLGTRMVTNFAAEILIFNWPVNMWTLLGAALMLSGCLIITLSRKPRPSVEITDSQLSHDSPRSEASTAASDSETLAAFASAEFVFAEGYEAPNRRRPEPQNIGAGSESSAREV
eukprot:TRINITY_DN24102_c0_g1_i1.p1 TRINITY_DN24102_c0_g1~~TRINITY_DN24102_c0_g1_i1.p1  ORF type:complete len:374 (-),score=55.59 TRINITY_DN24102_c0_g1_i1:471-1592(-)